MSPPRLEELSLAMPSESGASLLPAIFGLVGVIVGGLLTAISNYFLDKAKDRRQQLREDKAHRVRVRTAARLVFDDLDRAVAIGETLMEKKKWWISLSPPNADTWLQFRGDLALELPEDVWDQVSGGIGIIETWNTRRNSEMAKGIRDLSANTLENLPTLVGHLKAARDALQRYSLAKR
jgi:hypothetical protein